MYPLSEEGFYLLLSYGPTQRRRQRAAGLPVTLLLTFLAGKILQLVLGMVYCCDHLKCNDCNRRPAGALCGFSRITELSSRLSLIRVPGEGSHTALFYRCHPQEEQFVTVSLLYKVSSTVTSYSGSKTESNKNIPATMKSGKSSASRKKNLFSRLSGHRLLSKSLSATPGWTRQSLMFKTGARLRNHIWKTAGAACRSCSME